MQFISFKREGKQAMLRGSCESPKALVISRPCCPDYLSTGPGSIGKWNTTWTLKYKAREKEIFPCMKLSFFHGSYYRFRQCQPGCNWAQFFCIRIKHTEETTFLCFVIDNKREDRESSIRKGLPRCSGYFPFILETRKLKHSETESKTLIPVSLKASNWIFQCKELYPTADF